MRENVLSSFSFWDHSEVRESKRPVFQQLTPISDQKQDKYAICVIGRWFAISKIMLTYLETSARLWQLVCKFSRSVLSFTCGLSVVVKHRFQTFYGERHARLCRDQPILVDTARESRSLHILTSLLSFKASDDYVSRLNDIYVDHLVYAHQWQPFMRQCLKEWRSLLYLVSPDLHCI